MPPLWLNATDAATYVGVKPATLRVWRLRYGLTTRRLSAGATHYDLHELAAVLAGREAPGADGTSPSAVA